MCPSGNGDMKRAAGKLHIDNFKTLIDDIGDYILQVQLWNQGEPFINKSFLDFVRYAKLKGIMVQTSTNGHFIRSDQDAEAVIKSGLDLLIFSLDGTNQETYKKYRVGGNYKLVMETLKRLADAKKRLNSNTPLIELQFLIFKHNQAEIDQIISIGKELALNRISFKTAQIYSNQQADDFLPEEEKYRRYKQDANAYVLKGKIKNWCKRLWLNPAINWDGSFSPCCFDKDADYAFGNIFSSRKTFLSLWRGKRAQKFRNQILDNRKAVDMCTNCSEGLPEPYTRIVEISHL
jgi:radical SAM protein with 4Fe4S-binding SPASM domain